MRWVSRAEPLQIAAAVAIGSAAAALARRVLAMSDERRAQLHGAVSQEMFVVCGSELPWVDGVVYLGADPDAEGLLLPTARRPEVPAALFARAIAARFPQAARPLAVLESQRVLALGEARPLDVDALRRWLESRA